MNIPLTPDQEAMIQERVASGRYNSPGEVVGEGLRLLEQREKTNQEKLEALRREVQLGIDDCNAGRVYDGKEVFAELKRRGREAAAKQQ